MPAPRGMAELIRLFDTLPAGAEDDLKTVLPGAADAILAIERGDVPVFSGTLQAGLATQVLDGGLKVRAGLIGNTDSAKGKIGVNDLFYGRIVERGRKAQTVLVQRRRRVGGKLRTRRGRKIAADIVVAYKLRVRPEPARPFVFTAEAEAAQLAAMEQVADLIEKRLEGDA